MMREVIGLLGGIIMALYSLFFIVPMLATTKSGEAPLFNSTDPTIALSNTIGQGFYDAIWFVPVIIGLFLLIAFALKMDIGG